MKVYAGAQEVAVVYRVDEFSIELAVCVPDNYPLQAPTIKEGKRARVEISQWRKWLLQLSVFVANQVSMYTCTLCSLDMQRLCLCFAHWLYSLHCFRVLCENYLEIRYATSHCTVCIPVAVVYIHLYI